MALCLRRKQQDHWEAHSSDEPGKKQYWFNWVTGERRNSKPEGHQMNGSRHERQQYDRDLATALAKALVAAATVFWGGSTSLSLTLAAPPGAYSR